MRATPKAVVAGLVPAIHVLKSLRQYLAIAIVLLCAGCASYRPTDIRLISVEAVDLYDEHTDPAVEAAILKPGAETVRMSDTSTMSVVEWREWRARGRPTRRHLLELKITFATDENLSRLSQEGVLLGPSVRAFFCEDAGGKYDFRGGGGVKWNGIGVDSSDIAAEVVGATPKPRLYSFYVDVAVEQVMLRHGVPLKPYDLRHGPKDICFFTRVPYGFAPGIRSNEVRVPAEAVRAALRDLPSYFRH